MTWKRIRKLCMDLYMLLYQWKNENKSDNLEDLAGKVKKRDQAFVLKKLLLQKITQENILINY